jgi:PAS domain S-box-containing protein
MTDRELLKRLWLALTLIALPLLALIALETYQIVRSGPQLRESRERVVHTFEVITTAQALDRAIQDAERGQRGFLLTGDPAYLEPYRDGSAAAPKQFARLKELTSDSPEQQTRLADLEQQINVKLAELRHTVELRQQQGFEAALKIVKSDVGLDAMRTITATIDATVIFENAQLTQRLAQAEENEQRNVNAALIGALLAVTSMFLGVVMAVLAFGNARRAETARNQSDQRFHLLVEGVADHALYMLDAQGRVAGWNAGAQRLKGYGAEEIMGQHFSRFYTADDQHAGLPAAALEAAAREGKFEATGWRQRKDGSQFLANTILSPLRDQAGNLIGYAKITRDITEQRQQQLILEQTREALAQSQKMDALGQLSGGIAHDFNNLLAVMKNCVEILQRRLNGGDPELHRYFEMIQRSVDRAASLTQRMLAFSRRQPLAPKAIAPNKLISGMADLLRQALGESIALEVVLGSGAWLVLADDNQLEAAILNLAVNARDAMPQGGKLTIETSNAYLDEEYASAHDDVKAGQYGMIAISDSGSGMARDVIAKAFDPFFTTKEPGKGTGLGLSQVYGFIKQSGGHVKIYSELGEGTTVKLYLPRASASDATYELASAKPAAAGAAQETILLVEDDEDLRASTESQLRELGYRVLAAPDARFALEVLEQESRIDLLFTDVGLPNGMNGRQLADEARRRRPALKILYTTGYARNAIVHHGRLDPDVDLVLKPYTQATLANKIRQVLEKRGL